MGLTVEFIGFWPGFDPEDFFLPIFRAVFECEVVEVFDSNIPDLAVHSVFIHEGRSHPLMKMVRGIPWAVSSFLQRPVRPPPKPSRRIWFTGENVRPPASGFSATLSFDATSDINFRVPLWWLLFPAPGSRKAVTSESHRLGIQPSLEEAVNGRDLPQQGNRPKFACTFIGKPEPTRLEILSALESVGKVDKFGPYFGREVEHKFPVAIDYDFVVCPENDLYPGYITEKAVEAWACGAVPLYAGNDVYGDLNPHAVINVTDFTNLGDFCAFVQKLESDPEKLGLMRGESLLSKVPDYVGLVEFLRRVLA